MSLSPEGYRYGKEPFSSHPFWGDSGGGGDGDVTGVKGARETEYRTGDVNLSLSNIVQTGEGLEYRESDASLAVQPLTDLELQTIKSILKRG